MTNIGLTGGIGSGKSTVAKLFQKRGAHIMDLDLIAHHVEEPGGDAWKGIVAHFGKEVLTPEGKVNREILGEIVFKNRAKLEELNLIVHPAVNTEWKRRINDVLQRDGHAIIISDIPLLIEAGIYKRMDLVILVYVGTEVQIERVMKRNGYSRQEALDRLNSQMPLSDKIPFADFVINNEGTLKETEKAVEEVWGKILDHRRT